MVVADSRMRRDGRFIETVGYYNPMSRPEVIEISEERMAHWIQKGAQPSETVDRLTKRKQKGVVQASQKDRKRGAKAAAKRDIAARTPEPEAQEPSQSEPSSGEPAAAGAE
jgi:small subunit ribosomal protein S16